MKVYIAGPYTAETKEEIMGNVHTAIDIGNAIHELGHTPFIPHLFHYWDQRHKKSYEDWMDQCFEWLPTCDVLLLFEPSPGASREEKAFDELGRPVYYSLEEFIENEIVHNV